MQDYGWKSVAIIAIHSAILITAKRSPAIPTMNIESDYLAVRKSLREAKTKREFERILCVWLRLALSLNSKQIATAIGWTAGSVRRVQARFANEGIRCFVSKPTGGRKRENISIEREERILEKFVQQAKRGIPLNVPQLKQAYELSVGRAVPRSTIYRLIHRHGLKRLLPRARLIMKPGRNRLVSS